MCLTLPPLSFDDNKGIKISQLDMLIFVQVCRTIVKNLHSSIGSERTIRIKGIYKGSLCCKYWRQQESEDRVGWISSWLLKSLKNLRGWRHQRVWRSSEAKVQQYEDYKTEVS